MRLIEQNVYRDMLLLVRSLVRPMLDELQQGISNGIAIAKTISTYICPSRLFTEILETQTASWPAPSRIERKD